MPHLENKRSTCKIFPSDERWQNKSIVCKLFDVFYHRVYSVSYLSVTCGHDYKYLMLRVPGAEKMKPGQAEELFHSIAKNGELDFEDFKKLIPCKNVVLKFVVFNIVSSLIIQT